MVLLNKCWRRHRWLVACSLLVFIPGAATAQWQSMDGGVDFGVNAFMVSEDSTKLLVSGAFVHASVGSLRVMGLAKWDGRHWTGDGLAGGSGDTVNGSMNAVYAMARHNDTLFVAHHSIIWHYDPAMLGVAYLADSAWHPCGSPSSTFWVFNENGRLFGGGPDTVQGQHMPGVLEWVGGEWRTPPGSPFVTGAALYASAFWHDQYYFGGVFLALGSRKIVAFDGVDQWSGLGGGVGGIHINSIEGYGDSLYVGGFFTPGQDVQSKHLQIWDGALWKPFFPEVDFLGQVTDMAVYDGKLYIAAGYRFIDDTTVYGLLRYDGLELCAIGGPFYNSGAVMHLSFYQGKLIAALPPEFAPLPYEWSGQLPLAGLIPDRCVEVNTGIADSRSESTFNVYPNPVSQELTVQFGERKADQVVIMDATGRTIQQLPVQGRSSLTIPASGLAPGTYAVRVADDFGVRSAWFIRD